MLSYHGCHLPHRQSPDSANVIILICIIIIIIIYIIIIPLLTYSKQVIINRCPQLVPCGTTTIRHVNKGDVCMYVCTVVAIYKLEVKKRTIQTYLQLISI